jgi:hypothetical protein
MVFCLLVSLTQMLDRIESLYTYPERNVVDFTDTHPKIKEIVIAGYRKMSPQEKMIRVNEMTKGVQQLARARIQKEHPDESEREWRLRLASLWLDKELMKEAFDWDPEVMGY